jgi:hypothetical protein
MTAPFTYPPAPHVRRHGPRGYLDYESYRLWLRDDFSFRCVYCLTREAWGPFLAGYAIDHFLPLILRPDRATEYDNLLLSCMACNAIKGSQEAPDPTAVLVSPAVTVSEDGTLHADHAESQRLIKLLDLNRPRLQVYRKIWIDIIRVAAGDEGLYRRLMGYPNDLPNLARLRPPGGNARPEGVRTSCFAQRQAGTLPATY